MGGSGNLGGMNLELLKRCSIGFLQMSREGESVNRSRVMRSQASGEEDEDLRFTSHLNLKEGISNMKVSYIPDFGYSE